MNPSSDITVVLTETQKWILAILPRIAATISIICITSMAYCIIRNKWAIQRIYHRLMLGCTIPILILNTAQLWGPSAAPSDTTDWVIGATGNYTTCSIQGFMYQFRLVVPSYYLILSLLARGRLVVVTKTKTKPTDSNNNNNKKQQQRSNNNNNGNGNNNKVDEENKNTNNNNNNRRNIHTTQTQVLYMKRLKKMEPFLHVAVYIFPIMSGIYLLSIDGFNMILLGCGVSSEPLGCGDDSGIECTRGPQNPGFYQWLFAGLPSIILLGSSTIIMVVTFIQLCFALRANSSNSSNSSSSSSSSSSKQVAISMAKQSCLYLLAFYWTYIFRWIDADLILNHNMYIFGINLLAEIIDPLQGLWTLLVYWYFKQSKSSDDDDDDEKQKPSQSNNEIQRHPRITSTRRKSSSSSSSSHNQNQIDSQDNSTMSFRRKPEFSIFDGTRINMDSPWATYLFDDYGEDDEYIEFCGEYTDEDFGSDMIQETPPSTAASEDEEEEGKVEIQSHHHSSTSQSQLQNSLIVPPESSSSSSSTMMMSSSRMLSSSSSSSTTTSTTKTTTDDDDNKEQRSSSLKESIISKSTTCSKPQPSSSSSISSSTRTSCTARLSCCETTLVVDENNGSSSSSSSK